MNEEIYSITIEIVEANKGLPLGMIISKIEAESGLEGPEFRKVAANLVEGKFLDYKAWVRSLI